MVRLVSILFLVLLTFNKQGHTQESCSLHLLEKYLDYRKEILSTQLLVSKILPKLKPSYIELVKSDRVLNHFLTLRLKEAEIIQLHSYHTICSSDGKEGVLRVGVLTLNEIDMIKVFFTDYGQGLLIDSYVYEGSYVHTEKELLFKEIPNDLL